MTDGKTGFITPGGSGGDSGIEPLDPDRPRETDNGCNGKDVIIRGSNIVVDCPLLSWSWEGHGGG